MQNLLKRLFLLGISFLILMSGACQNNRALTTTEIANQSETEQAIEKNENQEKHILSEVYSKQMFYKEKYNEVGYYKPIGIHDNVFEYYYWDDLYRLNLQNYTEEIKEDVVRDFWYEKYDSSNILSDDTAYYYIELTEEESQREFYHINLICKDRNNFAILWKKELYSGEYFSYINRLHENTESIFVPISQTYQLFCIDKKDGSVKWVFEPAKTDKKVVFRKGSDCMATLGNKSIDCEFLMDDGLIVHLSSVNEKDELVLYHRYYLVSFEGKLINTFNEEPLFFYKSSYFFNNDQKFGLKDFSHNKVIWQKKEPQNAFFTLIGDCIVQEIESPTELKLTFFDVRNGDELWNKAISSTENYNIQELEGNYYILYQNQKDQSRYQILTWNAQTKGEKWIDITNQIEKKHTPCDEWTLMPSFDEYFVNDASIVSCSGNVFILTRLGFISLHDDQATYYPYKTDTVTYNFSLFENQTTFVLSYTAGGQGMIPGGKMIVLKDIPEEKPNEQKDTNQPANEPKDEEEVKETIPEWEEKSEQFQPDFKEGASKIVADPYKEVWNAELNENIGAYRPYMSRFYMDANGDTIPELFLSWYKGTGGRQYLMYQITLNGYLYLGNISIYSIEILSAKHQGFHDILVFWRLGRAASGETYGALSMYEFNGECYIEKKSMEITKEQASKLDLFHPDQENREEHPSNDTLRWSPKDDDQYRKVIK